MSVAFRVFASLQIQFDCAGTRTSVCYGTKNSLGSFDYYMRNNDVFSNIKKKKKHKVNYLTITLVPSILKGDFLRNIWEHIGHLRTPKEHLDPLLSRWQDIALEFALRYIHFDRAETRTRISYRKDFVRKKKFICKKNSYTMFV